MILKPAGRAVPCLAVRLGGADLRGRVRTRRRPACGAPLLPAAGFLVAALATVGPTSVQAQDTATQFQFPASRTAWINSQPFTREQLSGKVAGMVFFEEG